MAKATAAIKSVQNCLTQAGVSSRAVKGSTGRTVDDVLRGTVGERGCPTLPGAFFLLEGVQITEQQDVELLASRIDELEITPVLIVVDTLARCFVGGDKNSAQEMGEFVGGLDWLKQKTGAAVMVLHHTGKKAQETERGSTALRAAADVMIRVSKKGEQVTAQNNKQKDHEEFKDIPSVRISRCVAHQRKRFRNWQVIRTSLRRSDTCT